MQFLAAIIHSINNMVPIRRIVYEVSFPRTFIVHAEERTICQFHYVLWPDHGVPNTVGPLLHMVRLVRDCQASETLPVLVHCSAGCGRTGTICAIDYVWGLLRSGVRYFPKKLSLKYFKLSLLYYEIYKP